MVVSQTVQARHRETLDRMSRYLDSEHMAAAWACAQRLHLRLGEGAEQAPTVMVAYGGGKDSSYTVAFMRLVQLLLEQRNGYTFRLRTATNRHAGMPRSVTENIERTYSALGFKEDPTVEPLWVEGSAVRPFDPSAPLPLAIAERNRMDALMAGHRTGGEGRPTFCNACNFSMVASFRRAAEYGSGVEFIVTGDSTSEQRHYIAWVNSAGRRLGLARRRGRRGATGFLERVEDLSEIYFAELYGDTRSDDREPIQNGAEGLRGFFSIYQETSYTADRHWELLTEFLGFQFDELAFNFSETDCANPALMAHLRGLRTERLGLGTYFEGIEEYVRFALSLMQKKGFPDELIVEMRRRYATPIATLDRRLEIEAYAAEAFGLSPENLLCMVFAPFVDGAKGLGLYLTKGHPELAVRLSDIHRILGARTQPSRAEKRLVDKLCWLSGLPIEGLQQLYRSQRYLGSDLLGQGKDAPIPLLLEGDPHKATIEVRRGESARLVREVITGR